ncbi:aldolase [Athelia psychrophila]|uniref:Aldolase n=1 Tax=Athelia psychrophila TaxID=1759441 RepID=A0A166C9K3_9AGAM|nr:aldolase [Fibularhizoctonia sp. CBS 109695]KZP28172.1 aldolase [Fibularhizoctonia sp. CBS 109695]
MSSPTTLLTQISEIVTIDVDSMNPIDADLHTSTVFKFCDMTSNQAIVQGQASNPDRAQLLDDAVQSVTSKRVGVPQDQLVDEILDTLTVVLAKQVYPYLTGRVHAQAAPSTAYDTEGTVAHAKRLIAIFAENGIPKERVSIKIPATPQSILACQILEKAGIRTLATCLFSVPQAVAASQAGCLYVAPYFNELRVHFAPIWKEHQDTAKDHPMGPVIQDIVRVYRHLGSKTLIMPASIVTTAEVIALVSLRPNHLTLSGSVLAGLAGASPVSSAELSERAQFGASAPDTEASVDYLANGAKALQVAIESDVEVSRRLADALVLFAGEEAKTKDIIREKLAAKAA